MRWHEIESGVRLPVNAEEQAILDRASDGDVAETEMSERDQEVARLMVSKGLLNRIRQGDQQMYRASSVKDIWRDL